MMLKSGTKIKYPY